MTTRGEEPYEILFEDAALVAVDKPAGVLSVPPSHGAARNVADRLRRRALAAGEQAYPVHRLDRDTSGVLLFAKTAAARDALMLAFKDRRVKKRYRMIVHGRPRQPSGTITTYITDDGATARSSRRPSPRGKTARTVYRVLETFPAASLVEADPETGRFNQIRLHMVDLDCPIVGERKYAVASRYPTKHRRVLLHAARLEFPHPVGGRTVVVDAPEPADFRDVLERLRDARPRGRR